jgi:uncharacterized membrane protein
MENKAGKYYFKEEWTRSLAKALTYRILIIILDFSVIYIFTGRIDIAFWFMIASNVYTTIAYFAHERIWDRIKWGKDSNK